MDLVPIIHELLKNHGCSVFYCFEALKVEDRLSQDGLIFSLNVSGYFPEAGKVDGAEDTERQKSNNITVSERGSIR